MLQHKPSSRALEGDASIGLAGPAAGKQRSSEAEAASPAPTSATGASSTSGSPVQRMADWQPDSLLGAMGLGPVQHKEGGEGASTERVHSAAQRGVSGASQPLPHLAEIQQSFGAHDVSGVRAHVGGAASEAAGAMGANAYATGDSVAFASSPDLHLAAHEAAHVVQQRGGVQLKGGVGQVGDPYERHADAVADLVVQGKSAESLLSEMSPAAGGAGASSVQRQIVQLDIKADLRAAMSGPGVNEDALFQRCQRLSMPEAGAVLSDRALMRQLESELAAPQMTRLRELLRIPFEALLRQLNGLDETAFRTRVAALSRAETDALRANRALFSAHDTLISRVLNERLVGTAEGLEGELRWAGPSGPDDTDGYQIRTTTTRPTNDLSSTETNTNDFAVWVRGGPEPTTTSQMNCWEMVLFSGYRAGVIPREWITRVHSSAARAGDRANDGTAYLNVLSREMGFGAAAAWSSGVAVPRGNIVFFDGLNHVAIATGNVVGGHQEVMSLWVLPTLSSGALNSVNQRTTIEALVANGMVPISQVKHAPSPWR